VDRPIRQDLNNIVRRIVSEAEDLRLPSNVYVWHRRFVLGIDSSLESAQKRAADSSCERLPSLQRSAEMALYWIMAQKAGNESERDSFMSVARSIFEGLSI